MKKTKCIAIICALNKEVEAVIQMLGEVTLIEIDGFLFYEGNFNGKKIILCECGIGKVNAAILTTLIIREFKPDYLINSGVAGGYNRNLKPLDVVIGQRMFYYDVQLEPGRTDIRYGQLQGEPFIFPSSDELIEILKASDDKLKVGDIATADCFQTNRAYMDELVEKYFSDLNILAVDMESTAVAHVCYKFKIPFVVIRSISDVIGVNQEQVYDNFLERACHNSSAAVRVLLEKI